MIIMKTQKKIRADSFQDSHSQPVERNKQSYCIPPTVHMILKRNAKEQLMNA